MKTKEEIDNLAENRFNEKYYPISKKGFVEGYIQCQEDMAIEIAELKIICQEYSNDVKALNDMLNSLNMQD